jgi:hypothetical protein
MGRNLKDFRRQTDLRLMVGFVAILIFVGDGLVWWLYGPGAASLGLLCLLAGISPIALLWLILKGLEWLGRRTGQW